MASQPARAGAPAVALDAAKQAANLRCEDQSPGIAAYTALRQQAPHLFEATGDWQQGEITLLTQPWQLCEAQEQMRAKYAKRGSTADAWAASRAGVVLQDPYVFILREAVRFPNGKIGLYNRKVTRAPWMAAWPGPTASLFYPMVASLWSESTGTRSGAGA